MSQLCALVSLLLMLNLGLSWGVRLFAETHVVTLELNNFFQWVLKSNEAVPGTGAIKARHGGVVDFIPTSVDLSEGPPWRINITAVGFGIDDITVSCNVSDVDMSSAYARISVRKSSSVDTVSYVVGWIYFTAWSVSFYPQVYMNFKRKSVVGLNFDFLALNVVGFVMYSFFNCGLFYVKAVQDEYFQNHPRGVNPVQANDVFFSVHAAFITIVTIVQCFIYERAGQRVSLVSRGILLIFAFIFLVTLGLCVFSPYLTWLQFLYICSYIKLTITLIKYVPQAIMNHQRKSTIGWSIGNVLLDFTGGILSIVQMILQSYNYDDWNSIFGDPTKFGLGLFSVLFDILFIVQHYVLYPPVRYVNLDSAEEEPIINESESPPTATPASALAAQPEDIKRSSYRSVDVNVPDVVQSLSPR